MKNRQHITAFYLETLLMIVVFLSIILVLTRVFGRARAQSARAQALTQAVTLAQSTAEAVSASRDPQELCGILSREGSAFLVEDGGSGKATVFSSAAADLQEDSAQIPETGGKAAESAGQSPGTDEQIPEASSEVREADTEPAVISGQASEAAAQGAVSGRELALRLNSREQLLVQTDWTPSAEMEGMADARITVYEGGTGQLLYTLDTAVCTAR